MIRNCDSLVLEHKIFVCLDVIHVDAFHLLFASGVEGQAIPADMGEKESALEVQRVFDGLGKFVVYAMDSYLQIFNKELLQGSHHRVRLFTYPIVD